MALEDGAELETTGAEMREIEWLARSTGRRVIIVVAGHADAFGSAEANIRISRERADHVRRRLEAMGVSPDLLRAQGRGADSDDRRVAFHVR